MIRTRQSSPFQTSARSDLRPQGHQVGILYKMPCFLGGFSCWVQHPYECSPTSIKIAVLPRGSLFDTHARQGRQLLIYKFLNKIRCVGRSVGGDPRTSWSFSPAPPAEIAACSRPSASAPTAANIFAPCAIKRWAV